MYFWRVRKALFRETLHNDFGSIEAPHPKACMEMLQQFADGSIDSILDHDQLMGGLRSCVDDDGSSVRSGLA